MRKEWTLFLTFLKIGAFTFGGGYGMVSLVRETVISNGWLTESEFLNFIAVSESTPGPLAPDPKSILVFAILWLTHFGYKRIKKNCIVADYNDTLFCRTRHVAFGSIKHSLCQLAVRNRAALLFLRKYTAHYSRLTDAAIVE